MVDAKLVSFCSRFEPNEAQYHCTDFLAKIQRFLYSWDYPVYFFVCAEVHYVPQSMD